VGRLFAGHLEACGVARGDRQPRLWWQDKVEAYELLGPSADCPASGSRWAHTAVSYLREVSEQGLAASVRACRISDPFGLCMASGCLELQVDGGRWASPPTSWWLAITIPLCPRAGIRWGRAWLGGRLPVATPWGSGALDPVKHGLRSKRLLKTRSASRMPDIDTDFLHRAPQRGWIEYVTEALWRRQGGPDHHLSPHDLEGGCFQGLWPGCFDIPYGDPTASPSDSCGRAQARP